jgi:hypothetical protein
VWSVTTATTISETRTRPARGGAVLDSSVVDSVRDGLATGDMTRHCSTMYWSVERRAFHPGPATQRRWLPDGNRRSRPSTLTALDCGYVP